MAKVIEVKAPFTIFDCPYCDKRYEAHKRSKTWTLRVEDAPCKHIDLIYMGLGDGEIAVYFHREEDWQKNNPPCRPLRSLEEGKFRVVCERGLREV